MVPVIQLFVVVQVSPRSWDSIAATLVLRGPQGPASMNHKGYAVAMSARGRGDRKGRGKGNMQQSSTADAFTVMLGAGPAAVFVFGGVIYVSESTSNRVVRVERDGSKSVVAGGNGKGSRANQLDRPWRIFVSEEGVYVVDRNNARVQLWRTGSSEGETVAGGHGAGLSPCQLDQPVDVFVHADTIYVVDRANHRVMKWASGAREGVLVAGGCGFGAGPHQLACPASVAVGSGGIFVSDEANNRVQYWAAGAQEAVTIAGGKGAGDLPQQFYHPLGICVAGGHLFVADSLNYRVQKWRLQGDGSSLVAHCVADIENSVGNPVTVAGGCGLGAGLGQLGQPMTIAVDDDGCLIVADIDNSRVQRYPLAEQAHIADHVSSRISIGSKDQVKSKRQCGNCVEYQARGGFGFVVDDAGRRLFAHHSDVAMASVAYGYPKLNVGERVEFDVMKDEKWRWRCSAITAPGGGPVGV